MIEAPSFASKYGTLAIEAGEEELKSFILQALPEWEKLVADAKAEILLENLTEGGGGRTIKASLKLETTTTTTTTYALKVVMKIMTKDLDWRWGRMCSSQAAWAKIGVSPAILARGDNWSISAFEGAQSKVTCEDDAFRLGQVVAKLGFADTTWFESFREEVLRLHPAIEQTNVGNESNIWHILSRRRKDWSNKPFGGSENNQQSWPLDLVKDFCDGGAFTPVHQVLNRVINFQGDLHRGNIIEMEGTDGKVYKIIDFEFVGVGPAVIDMTMVLEDFRNIEDGNGTKGAYIPKFIEGYFSGLNLKPSTEEEVEQIVLDSALNSFGFSAQYVGCFDLLLENEDAAEVQATPKQTKAFAARVRSSPELQAQWKNGKDLYYEIWKCSQEANLLPEKVATKMWDNFKALGM